MSDQFKFTLYAWVDWAMKAVLLAGVALIWQIYNSVQDMRASQSNQAIVQQQQAVQIAEVRNTMEGFRRDYVTRIEMLETTKRVEQQLTIMTLQSQVEKGRK